MAKSDEEDAEYTERKIIPYKPRKPDKDSDDREAR